MTEQIPLFVEDITEALRLTVQSIGGFKKVGAELKPELAADAAGRWLADCLSPHRRERLCPEQVGWIRRKARAAGVHILADFEARDAGYEPPKPLVVEDERAKAQREFVAAVDYVKTLATRMEQLNRAG